MTYLVKNSFTPREKRITQTSPAIQNNLATSSWTDIAYSEISFTPNSIDTYVQYEFICWVGKDGSSGSNIVNAQFKLLKNDGGGWVDYGENTEIFIGSQFDEKRVRSVLPIKFLLESWGNKEFSLKLQAKKLNGDVRFHKFIHFQDDGGNASDSEKYFYPSVSCQSVS